MFAKSSSLVSKETLTITETGNLTELILLYPKTQSGIPVIKDYLKWTAYNRHVLKCIDIAKKKHAVDVIHLNTIFPACIPTLKVIKKLKCPLFITEHWSGYYSEDGNYIGFLMKYYTRKIVAKANAVFVISEKLKTAMQNHHLNSKYELINNVVDTGIFKPTYSKAIDNKLRILHVSSLVDKEKNITGIIEIAKRLKKKNKPFLLTIVGDNPYEIYKHKMLAHENLLDSEIIFVGYKAPIEIANYMNDNDVFLLFSHYEGMPAVLLESMSCGLPVISTSVGQVKSIVKPNFGILLNSTHVDECVEKLCNFNRSNFVSSQIMHNEIYKLYSYQKVCSSITQLYSSY